MMVVMLPVMHDVKAEGWIGLGKVELASRVANVGVVAALLRYEPFIPAVKKASVLTVGR
jgi:hypothetical protein